MVPQLRVVVMLVCSWALLGCAGTAPETDPLRPTPAGDGAVLPDSTAPDWMAPDWTAPDAGPGADLLASAPDGAPCSVVIPLGKYKGDLSGEAAGKIIFNIVAGPAVGAGKFKLTQPKEATYPLALGGLDCKQLHAAIARPLGSTGGTDLRGSIVGLYRPAKGIFVGNWTMPFGQGKFKAYLQP